MIINKVVRVGKIDRMDMFCKVQFDGDELSITGVEGPLKNGDCKGSCGQLILGFKEYDHRGYKTLADIILQDNGWTEEMVKKFFDIWSRWHLNYMKAGTPAQEQYLREYPVMVIYPESHYTKACEILTAAGLNPDNGYEYGSRWLKEDVPQEVLNFLASLPDTDKAPAWV